ncbi:MAG: potassium transporter TrkA [Nitratiruptor sp.]|nr:potassium transporter TrkA [Nitratiruptor sp.]NPA83233.1 potassium transporter TrkA [Campylobacterota bacterium]
MGNLDVLILADGIVAKHLLRRIATENFTTNRYHVVYTDPQLKPATSDHDRLFFYRFDPTSLLKLSKLFSPRRSFKKALIVLGNRNDALAVYHNLRTLDKNLPIVLFDRWDLALEEERNLIRIEANEILANRLFDQLPNVPLIAQHVGLGHGEIMEVIVPFGSSYCYRHVGTIEQKRWRIAAIYRNNRLILPSPDIMIWPNDLLLLVGDPQVLRQVFRSIKREVGQFPLPYGIDSYLFIDMERYDREATRQLFDEALFVHRHLNDRRLFIRVANPNDFALLRYFRDHEERGVEVAVDYRSRPLLELIQEDLEQGRFGLFILHQESFLNRKLRRLLYRFKLPVLTLAKRPISKARELVTILTPREDLEAISSLLFDIAIQLDLAITLYQEPGQDGDGKLRRTIEHFENLAHIFSKRLSIKKARTNIIRELRSQEHLLLLFPLTPATLQAHPWNIFCTDPLKLFFKLPAPQIFIPYD